MDRRDFLKTLSLGSATMALPQFLKSEDEKINGNSPRPNILFIMSDDHALEAISCYGSWLKNYVQTPTIDRLAAEGMRFTNVCCNYSLCSPSRASIITGQYSHINGVRNLGGTLKPDAPSYIVELKKAGYQTAVYGKWHMKQSPRGCDDYAITTSQGKYFNPRLSTPEGTQNYQGYYADIYTDIALEWLEKRDSSKPFYLSLHFKGPHHPYDYPERLEHLLEDVYVPPPSNLHEDVTKTSPLLKARFGSRIYEESTKKSYYARHLDELESHGNSSEDKRNAAFQRLIHKYIRCVAAIDENVDRILKYLEEADIKNDTIIIYTSDQGYWLGQHGMYDKRLILEESLMMPFIVRYPKEVRAGSVCEKLVSNVDFAETLLDFASITAPEKMQGCSIRPLLRGNVPEDWQDAVFYAYPKKPVHWGVRTERYKLVHFPDTDAFEFYDLKKDPREMKNEAHNSPYAAAIADCEKKLKALSHKIGFSPEWLRPGKEDRELPDEEANELHVPSPNKKQRGKKNTKRDAS